MMSSKILTALIIALALWGMFKLYGLWKSYERQGQPPAGSNVVSVVTNRDVLKAIIETPVELLPEAMEKELAAAKKEGAEGLKRFLTKYSQSTRLKDPWRAEIELDYAISVAFKDPAEAKRVFTIVKARIKPQSPVYERVRKLSPNFE